MMWPSPDRSDRVSRSGVVTFTFDGVPIEGHEGEPLIAALFRAGHVTLRHAPRDAAPRGAFCCMGLCQECLVLIDGQRVEACRATVAEGLGVGRVA